MLKRKLNKCGIYSNIVKLYLMYNVVKTEERYKQNLS